MENDTRLLQAEILRTRQAVEDLQAESVEINADIIILTNEVSTLTERVENIEELANGELILEKIDSLNERVTNVETNAADTALAVSAVKHDIILIANAVDALAERTADTDVAVAKLIEQTADTDVAVAKLVEQTADTDVAVAKLVEQTANTNVVVAALVERTANTDTKVATLIKETTNINTAINAINVRIDGCEKALDVAFSAISEIVETLSTMRLSSYAYEIGLTPSDTSILSLIESVIFGRISSTSKIVLQSGNTFTMQLVYSGDNYETFSDIVSAELIKLDSDYVMCLIQRESSIIPYVQLLDDISLSTQGGSTDYAIIVNTVIGE